MGKEFDVVGLGYTAFDFLAVVPYLPEENTKLEIESLTLQGGGPAATACVTLARLGLKTAFIGKVGDDYFGRSMIEGLVDEGIDVSSLVVESGKSSQTAFIMINGSNASRTILWTRGSVSRLEPGEVNMDLVSSAKGLLIDDLECEAALEAARRAAEEQTIVVLDAGSRRPGVDELLRYSDYIVASERFAADTADSVEDALKKLFSYGSKASVVTLGERGCAAFDGDVMINVPGFHVEAVDTTGAGDVFHGAFLFGVLKGWELEKICIFANAVAALKCTSVGGRSAIPDYRTAVDFIKTRRNGIDL